MTAAIEAARALPADDEAALVKVRFKGERRFLFVGDGGRASHLRVRASMFKNRALAVAVADDQLAHGAEYDVVAVAVMQADRRVYFAGEATPAAEPAPYGPHAGHRWLVRATKKGHPVCEAKNADGTWGHFTAEEYEAAYYEARDAGLDPSQMTVYGATCGIATRGLKFRQVVNR